MKIKIRSLLMLIVIFATGALLLHTSQKVQMSENKVRGIKEKIVQEEETIKILRTEWAFLNNPERLEVLAAKYLDVKPIAPVQLNISPAAYFPDPALEELPGRDETAAIPVSFQASPVKHVVTPSPVKTEKKDFTKLLRQVANGAMR